MKQVRYIKRCKDRCNQKFLHFFRYRQKASFYRKECVIMHFHGNIVVLAGTTPKRFICNVDRKVKKSSATRLL